MTVALIILFSALFLIAIIYGKSSNVDEYFSNFQKTGVTTLVASLLASLVGGWMFFGLTQIGYEAGIAGIAIGVGYSIGLLAFALRSSEIYKLSSSLHAHNLLDVISSIFKGRVYKLSLLVNIIFFFGVLGAQFVALKSLVYAIPTINGALTFGVISLVVILYTSIGGFKGVLITDKYQMIGIVMLITVFSISLAPEKNQVLNLSSQHLLGTGYGIPFLVIATLVFPFTVFCRADLWQRASSSLSAHSFKKAIQITVPILLVIYALFTFFGMMAATDGTEPIPYLLTKISLLLGKEVGPTLFVFGLGCALISTIDTNTNVLTRIIHRALPVNNKSSLTIPRIISFVIGLSALMLALYVSDIVDLIISVGAVILVMFPMVASLFKSDVLTHPQKYENPAFFSMLVGVVSLLVSAVLLDIKSAFLVGFLCSYIVWFVVRQLYKNK